MLLPLTTFRTLKAEGIHLPVARCELCADDTPLTAENDDPVHNFRDAPVSSGMVVVPKTR